MDLKTPRLPTGALFMLRLGAEHGVPATTCLSGTGLDAQRLTDPSAEITGEQELRVASNVVAAVGDVPGLGIRAGRMFRLTSYGIWGFAILSSPTVREAVDLGLRFVDLTFALCEVDALFEAGRASLLLGAGHLDPGVRRFCLERDATGFSMMTLDVLGFVAPAQRVAFSASRPDDDVVALYTQTFGCEPEFDAERTVLEYDDALLDLPLPMANEVTTTLAVEQCLELLRRRQARTGLAGQVRELLVRGLADPPSAAELARALHLGERTLRHRLAAEGTTYRALLDEVRERMAEELLVGAGLPVAEVARRLGYVEVSSFSQAFTRWKGVGPRAWRQAAAQA